MVQRPCSQTETSPPLIYCRMNTVNHTFMYSWPMTHLSCQSRWFCNVSETNGIRLWGHEVQNKKFLFLANSAKKEIKNNFNLGTIRSQSELVEQARTALSGACRRLFPSLVLFINHSYSRYLKLHSKSHEPPSSSNTRLETVQYIGSRLQIFYLKKDIFFDTLQFSYHWSNSWS